MESMIMYHQLLIRKATATHKKICASNAQLLEMFSIYLEFLWNYKKNSYTLGNIRLNLGQPTVTVVSLIWAIRETRNTNIIIAIRIRILTVKTGNSWEQRKNSGPIAVYFHYFPSLKLFLITLLNLNLKQFIYILTMIILWFVVIDEHANTFNIVNE